MMRLPPTKDAIKEWKEHPERLCNFIEGLIKAAKFDMEEPFWFSYKDGVITLTGTVQKIQTNNDKPTEEQ